MWPTGLKDRAYLDIFVSSDIMIVKTEQEDNYYNLIKKKIKSQERSGTYIES